MGQQAGVGEDLGGPTQQEHHQVDDVNGLVHRGAAAVHRPGAPPGRGVVVGLSAPPRAGRDRRGDGAEPAGLIAAATRLRRSVESVLGDHRHPPPGLPLGGDDPIGVRQRQRNRLLQHHMLAGPQCADQRDPPACRSARSRSRRRSPRPRAPHPDRRSRPPRIGPPAPRWWTRSGRPPPLQTRGVTELGQRAGVHLGESSRTRQWRTAASRSRCLLRAGVRVADRRTGPAVREICSTAPSSMRFG